jgi:hypothetical protein
MTEVTATMQNRADRLRYRDEQDVRYNRKQAEKRKHTLTNPRHHVRKFQQAIRATIGTGTRLTDFLVHNPGVQWPSGLKEDIEQARALFERAVVTP